MDSRDLPLDRPAPALLRRWLREPLLHVLLIGAALFVIYYALNPRAGQRQDSNRIAITADDLAQIRLAWMAQWQRPPTPEEMRHLLHGKIREEVLFREAMGLGLDKDDTIVKRRLAQKMEFVMEDASTLREPASDELRHWFTENAQRFVSPKLGDVSPSVFLARFARRARARRRHRGPSQDCRQAGRNAGAPKDCPTASCSRISMQSGRLIRSRASSGRASRRRCRDLSRESGMAPLSPAWAGIWFGLNRSSLAGYRPSKKSRQGSNRNGAMSNAPRASARCSII